MHRPLEAPEEQLAKLQILAFIEEHCRNLTLREVREWYMEAFALESRAEIVNHP
jgi:hypothetical protein